eukprot:TRINITY_DN9911_c0_g1_i3.p1 TRINITY_DN9911_c0_g1~~TRINITY_DN9911_c0_g1_i3.p1  ORF type:complete len:189 (+),score=32.90 TRINITY_DN9911_c0_g1_i3:23-568(+)
MISINPKSLWEFARSKPFRKKLNLVEMHFEQCGGRGTMGVGVILDDFDMWKANTDIKMWTILSESWNHCTNGHCMFYGSTENLPAYYDTGDTLAILADLNEMKVTFFKGDEIISSRQLKIHENSENAGEKTRKNIERLKNGTASFCFLLTGMLVKAKIQVNTRSQIQRYLNIINEDRNKQT